MGQMLSANPKGQLLHHTSKTNTKQAITYHSLSICPAVKVPFHSIISKGWKDDDLQIIVKFFNHQYVFLKLSRRQSFDVSQGVYFHSVGDYVYGYKNKNFEKVRKDLIMYKKRIYGEEQDLVRRFAELKLMSLMEVGPRLGRMINDADGYITDQYIQFYTEVALEINTSPDKFKDKVMEVLVHKGFKVDRDIIHQLTFSPNLKCHIIKQRKYLAPGQSIEQSMIAFNNNSSTYLRKQYDEQSLKTIKNLDKKTTMLSCIENLLIQKNIEKAIQVFEDNASSMDQNAQKMRYIQRFCNIISENIYFKDYEEQVLVEALTTSCLLKEYAYTNPENKRLEERLNKLKMSSTQFGSENELQEFSHTFDLDENSHYSMKKEQLKINVFSNNKKRIREIMKELKEEKKEEQQDSQNNDYNYEIEYEFATLLMKSAKSRHALVVFELLVRHDEVPQSLKYQIYNWMGVIYYHKNQFRLAKRDFQNGLTQLIKLRNYSTSMMLAYNNIGCSLYRLGKTGTCLDYFGKALNCGDYSADYEMMLRNNRAMAFIQKNMLKEARNQFVMILKIVQPINNASIICKTFTNMGYLDMIEKDYNQAMTDLDFASKIENTCLIPIGFKPSVYLHNNIAMLHYKRREFRKAASHFEKCREQLETVKNFQAMLIHFNYAMALVESYQHDKGLKQLGESRRILQRLDEDVRLLYQRKIQNQIQKLNSVRIVEDSQQSSYRQSFCSKYSVNQKIH